MDCQEFCRLILRNLDRLEKSSYYFVLRRNMKSLNPRHRHTKSGQITVALYRISQAIHHLLRRRAEQTNLSAAQVQALLFLKHTRSTAHTIGGVAKGLALAYATTSAMADALERKGLVERQTLERDRRTIALRLTPQGEVTSSLLEDVLDQIEHIIENLPVDEQEVLQRVIQKIVFHLSQNGHIQLYDMCWHCQFFRRNAHPEDPARPHHCTFIDAPLAEADTYFDCPDFQPQAERR